MYGTSRNPRESSLRNPALSDQVPPDRRRLAADPEPGTGDDDDQDEIAGERAEAQRQDPEEVDHEPRDRVGQEIQPAERDRRAEQPDHRALEHERPADERV